MRVAILTVSDSVSRGKAEDGSGPALVARCKELSWEVVSTQATADDRKSIEGFLATVADSGVADLILTTGGTGLGPRDVTPEATMNVAERMIPGFSEHMRSEGMKKMPRAIMSRAVAAIRGTTIILNLPGSPKGAVESFDLLAYLLPHAIEVLHGMHHG